MFKLPSPLQAIDISHLTENQVKLWLKRDDLIHPQLSGNKWRKLKYYFESVSNAPIVSFGGAYSNHLHALAYAGKYFNRPVHALVRADFIDPNNLTLQDCLQQGMTIECIDRQTYRQKHQADFLLGLQQRFPTAQIIAEGGFGELGIKGIGELVTEIDVDFSHIICPVGSATTLTGVLCQLQAGQKVIGVAALAKAEYLQAEIEQVYFRAKQSQVLPDYHLWCHAHFGGFGKIKPELLDFIAEFYHRYQILLDPVYTGKMMFAVFEAIKAGAFNHNSRLVAVHTGGLQGWRGFEQRGLLPQGYLKKLNY